MPHYRNVGSRLGATEPLTPPPSRNFSLTAATLHPPHTSSPVRCSNVGSRHGATVPPSQPRSGNCRLTAHRDATHGPPHCYPACSADSTLPTLPQCRVAPWCDRATNPTAPPSVTLVLLVLLVLLDLFLSTLREISAVSAGFCVGEGRLAWGGAIGVGLGGLQGGSVAPRRDPTFWLGLGIKKKSRATCGCPALRGQ